MVQSEPISERFSMSWRNKKRAWILEGHLMSDHVHMCISIPPKFAVSNVVGFIKGKSAISVARNFRGRRRNFRKSVRERLFTEPVPRRLVSANFENAYRIRAFGFRSYFLTRRRRLEAGLW